MEPIAPGIEIYFSGLEFINRWQAEVALRLICLAMLVHLVRVRVPDGVGLILTGVRVQG